MFSSLTLTALFAISSVSIGSTIDTFEYNKYNDDFSYQNTLKLTASSSNNNSSLYSYCDIYVNVNIDFTLSYANQDYYALFVRGAYLNVTTGSNSYNYSLRQTYYSFDIEEPFMIGNVGNINDSNGSIYYNLYANYDDGLDVKFILDFGNYTYQVYIAEIFTFGDYWCSNMSSRVYGSQIDNVIMDYLDSDYSSLYRRGYEDGELVGYSKGHADGAQDASDFSISSILFTIFNAPVAIFGGMLNFTIFGVNIKNLVFFLLTIGLIVWIISVFKGGGSK